MPDRTCTVPGCERSTRGGNAELCKAHYFRMRRTGQVGSAEIAVKNQPRPGCSVDGCDRTAQTHAAGSMCELHYRRTRTNGSPDIVQPNRARGGEGNYFWKGDQAGYGAAHERVRSERGRASDHACTSCGRRARHWAYDHTDPNELAGERNGIRLPYSLDIGRYNPMCVPCHKRFDLGVLAAEG